MKPGVVYLRKDGDLKRCEFAHVRIGPGHVMAAEASTTDGGSEIGDKHYFPMRRVHAVHRAEAHTDRQIDDDPEAEL